MNNKMMPAAAVFLAVVLPPLAHGAEAADAGRGEYLATIMDCAGCHTGGALLGAPDPARHLAGAEVGFQIPGLGVFYPPNLTSDAKTGLGDWSAQEIINAVREGVRPDGRQLAPVMPWPNYAALTDDDAAALAAYIKGLPPIRFGAPGPFGPDETPTSPYLAVQVPGAAQ